MVRLDGDQFEGQKFDPHPQQAFRIGSLFSGKQADGTRRYRRFYDEEGKGTGKSRMLAGFGLYCLLADGEARAEIYAAGAKKDQAKVLFHDAAAPTATRSAGGNTSTPFPFRGCWTRSRRNSCKPSI